jgi:hypothetical protein
MTKEVTIYRDKGYQLKLNETEYENDNVVMTVEVEEMGVVSEQVLFLTPEEIVAMGYKFIAAAKIFKGTIIDIKA